MFPTQRKKEVILERQQFVTQVDVIGRSLNNMDTARIVFTDGESHVVQTWTIKDKGEKYVEYHDVHSALDSKPVKVPYSVIAHVELYAKRKQSA